MAITFDQAVKLSQFHEVRSDGAACRIWRRNGQTQTWATRPGHYRVPVKFGMYVYADIVSPEQSHANAGSGANAYAREDCPVCHGAKS